ncbi:ATP-binding protein [Acuticoccus sp. MNP-M23]|uniref:hybrid sensor histidine kinase/response regulator n=1 Tax=Acuticoccus sp. MNP-M23 TaxID=3072793 RepID=UPI00281559EA|nr:ATP-binding protein [Acuticoccus sp. MNP-M23]WMS41382.1 ATP-binding protein [Acuticoccus sp. MNP-M23]
MTRVHTITRRRRTYNQWVANETLEDFALRFTARRARRWTPMRVANTAIGSISFLALEAIGAALTLSYGFDNAVAAMMIVGALLFLTGLPISYHAAKSGVDIDLLTRGAGFGYIGSTITSLIYASFTFIFFALEAAILSLALEYCFGIPLGVGYLLNALVVIPLVTHGFTKISFFQKWTQAIWVVLHIVPFVCVAFAGGVSLREWGSYTPPGSTGGLDLLMLGAASGVVFSLIAQIGEQVDFLRFLPEPKTARERRRWWAALVVAGPGWSVLGVAKMLAGSYLAVLALSAGASAVDAADPTHMYLAAFQTAITNPAIATALVGAFVMISQLKINVTNAYAGSIAWSNFFSRLTHAHPGRVVWLVFNVLIALALMQLGVFAALEATLTIYATVAVAWVGALVADLTVNKPLGLSPRGIEFRRGHLYDINPVGLGAMVGAVAVGFAAHAGHFGATAAAFATPLAFVVAFVLAPLIAAGTRGRFYIARPAEPAATGEAECTVCGNHFETDDILHCPFYAGMICSLCCSLDARCADACRPHAQLREQASHLVDFLFPPRLGHIFKTRYAAFAALMTLAVILMGIPLRYVAIVANDPASVTTPAQAVWLSFAVLVFVAGVAIWLFVLAQEASRTAMRESDEQAQLLMREIRAHKRTDAQLRQARKEADAANGAKSRYVVGITHELRTPLNAILGYAQLMEADPDLPPRRHEAVSVIRRSGEHLSGLIEGLLDISKIEAGRLEIHSGTVNLPDFLNQLVAVFRMQADDKGLAFTYVEEEKVPDWVRCDERRLRQILMNLLTNAIRYTEKGEVVFKVGYRSEVAHFTVSDTGVGIDPAEVPRIFMPFARLKRPGGPVVPGTGLGLTITKLLTEVQGGEIKVVSAPGAGSAFSVRLMLPRVHRTTSVPVTDTRIVTGYTGPRRTLMLVEDEPDHGGLMADVLRPIGFTLHVAGTAEIALDLVREMEPDLFLLDVRLPGMSGWDLAEQLRAGGCDAPIVMVSAHAADRLAREARAGLADEFIAKPINIEDLLVRLERQLGLAYTLARPGLAPAPRRGHLVPLPTAHIEELRHFAEIGWPRGLSRALARIEADAPDLSGTVAHLRSVVATFDMQRLGTILDEMEESDEA